MICDNCIHKKVCDKLSNIKTETYAYMGVRYDPDKECNDFCSNKQMRGIAEFEFDEESANRISDIINKHVMCLRDCADIMEILAPLCDYWTTEVVKLRIKWKFDAEIAAALESRTFGDK